MPLDLTDDKSTLVQVMAWCRRRDRPVKACRYTMNYLRNKGQLEIPYFIISFAITVVKGYL